MLVGRESHKDEVDSYFNLVYGIIQIAIHRKMKKINMGQTAYWVKQRLGACPVPVYIYLKSRRPLINIFLTKFNRLLFPELVLRPIKALKDPDFVKEVVSYQENVST